MSELGHSEVVGVLHEAAAHEELHGEVGTSFSGVSVFSAASRRLIISRMTMAEAWKTCSVGGLLAGHAEVAAKLILKRAGASHPWKSVLLSCKPPCVRPCGRTAKLNPRGACGAPPGKRAQLTGRTPSVEPFTYELYARKGPRAQTLLPLGSTSGSLGEPERGHVLGDDRVLVGYHIAELRGRRRRRCPA